MLWILVKNQLKLVLRDPLCIVFGVVFPLLLMSSTSIYLKDSLMSEIRLGQVKVGYTVTCPTDEQLQKLLEALKQEEIEAVAMTLPEGKEGIAVGHLAGYFEWDESMKVLYLPEAMTDQSVYLKDALLIIHQGMKIETIKKQQEKLINHRTVDAPSPTAAKDYYGIIELASCLWVGAYFAGKIASCEKKDGVLIRIEATAISTYTIYFSRMLVTLCTQLLLQGSVLMIGTIALNIQWGIYGGHLLGLMLIELLTAVSVNTTLSFCLPNEWSFVLIAWLFWIVEGFLGGAYQNLWHNFIGIKWQKGALLYGINRSLVDIRSIGISDFLMPTLIKLVALTVVSMMVGICWIQRRRGHHATFRDTP